MFIYLLNLFVVVLLSFVLNFSQNKRVKIFFLLVVGTQLILLSALRGIEVGSDTASYRSIYEYHLFYGDFFRNRLEFAHNLVMHVIDHFNGHYQWIFVVYAVLTISFMFKGIYNTSSNVYLSVFVYILSYFYYFSFSGIRQWLAAAIIFYAYSHVINKNFIKFSLCVFLASSFHAVSVVMIVVYLIYNTRLFTNKLSLAVLFFGGLVTFVFYEDLLNIALRILPQYVHYLNTEFTDATGYVTQTIFYGSFVLFGILTMVLYNTNRRFKNEFVIMSVALLLTLLSHFRLGLLIRVANYFVIFGVLFLPTCLEHITDKRHKMVFGLFMLSVLIVHHTRWLVQEMWNIVPYSFFFND